MIHQEQVGGKFSFLISVEKKRMKEETKIQKVKIGIRIIFSLNSPIIHPITQEKLYKPKRPN